MDKPDKLLAVRIIVGKIDKLQSEIESLRLERELLRPHIKAICQHENGWDHTINDIGRYSLYNEICRDCGWTRTYG